jgi:hypothetical protein
MPEAYPAPPLTLKGTLEVPRVKMSIFSFPSSKAKLRVAFYQSKTVLLGSIFSSANFLIKAASKPASILDVFAENTPGRQCCLLS